MLHWHMARERGERVGCCDLKGAISDEVHGRELRYFYGLRGLTDRDSRFRGGRVCPRTSECLFCRRRQESMGRQFSAKRDSRVRKTGLRWDSAVGGSCGRIPIWKLFFAGSATFCLVPSDPRKAPVSHAFDSTPLNTATESFGLVTRNESLRSPCSRRDWRTSLSVALFSRFRWFRPPRVSEDRGLSSGLCPDLSPPKTPTSPSVA
jgi:hypothetical protein